MMADEGEKLQAEPDRPRGEKERVYWIDWSRTQAVWNVVCGHCWWTTLDRFEMEHPVKSPRNQLPWTEESRMLEYTVDQGAFFTIPLFFLVSGILASKTLKDDLGPVVWLTRRMYRIIPPFISGAILIYIERQAAGYNNGLKDIMMSRIWFLWALFAIQFVTFPFCMVIRLCRNGSLKTQSLWAWLGGHVIFEITVVVVFEVQMKIGKNGRPWWVAAFPLATTLVILLFMVGSYLHSNSQGKSQLGHCLKVLAVLTMGMSSFLLAVHEICPIPHCGEWDSLSVNTAQAVVLVVICYLTGFLVTESLDSIEAVLSGPPLAGMAVTAYLLSSYWPVFTFWGEQFIRKNAWLITYQEVEVYPLSPVSVETPERMPGGMGPAWAIAKMWFWMFAMLLFGKGFCNHEVHPFLHRHITQSSIVVFIIHRLLDVHFSRSLKDAGMDRPEHMVMVLIVLVFVCSFAIYALLVQVPIIAFCFGIRDIDLSKNILPFCPGQKTDKVEMKVEDPRTMPSDADPNGHLPADTESNRGTVNVMVAAPLPTNHLVPSPTGHADARSISTEQPMC